MTFAARGPVAKRITIGTIRKSSSCLESMKLSTGLPDAAALARVKPA